MRRDVVSQTKTCTGRGIAQENNLRGKKKGRNEEIKVDKN
jgi:hypothetical protein